MAKTNETPLKVRFDWYHFSTSAIIAILAFVIYNLSQQISVNESQITTLNTLLMGRTSLFQNIIKQETAHTKQLDALIVLETQKCSNK